MTSHVRSPVIVAQPRRNPAGTPYARANRRVREGWVAIGALFVALGGQYLVPIAIERIASFSVGSTRILLAEAALPLILLSARRIANKALFWWGVSCTIYAAVNGLALSRDLEAAFVSTLEAFGPLILLGVLPFTDRHRTVLRALVTVVLGALILEVILYASGVLSHPAIAGRSYGGLDRVYTTVGSPTSTGAVLFMLGAWCVDLWGLNWRGLLVGAASLIGVGVTFSRGPMAMAGVAAAATAAIWISGEPRRLGGIRRAAILAGLLAFGTTMAAWTGVLQGITDAVEERFEEGSGDAGRMERYEEAWSAFTRNPIVGIGTGEYYGRARFAESSFQPVGRTSPHNMFLLALVENGIIGGLLFAVGLAFVVLGALRQWRQRPMGLSVAVVGLVGMNIEVIYSEAQYGLLFAALVAWFGRPAEPSTREAADLR